MDYDFARVSLTDDTEEARARRGGFLQAVQRGFHSSRADGEFEKHWLAHVRTDRAVLAGAWLPEGEFGAGPVPVATISWFDKTLNAGLELVPVRMITDVTTSPAHRRRGLVRRLMEDCLDDAVAHDVPVVALTASEATIYGRWGFGVATFSDKVEVDTGPRFGLRDFTDPGRVELIEPADSWPVIRDVFDRFHAQVRGSVEWPAFYEQIHTGAYDFDSGPDKKLRGAVHLDAHGDVDGVVLYRPGDRDGETRPLAVSEMMALTPPAGLALWDFLASIDLRNKVTFSLAVPHDPLTWALTDVNVLQHTGHHEFLWLRILDVPRALAARPWVADDVLVLAVDDPQEHASGTYRVASHDGRADVARTDEDADVRLTAETLATLYLGTAPVSVLHRAGRLQGSDEAVARLAAMADLSVPPYSLTGF